MIIVPSIRLPHPDHPSPSDRDSRGLFHDWEWLGFQRVHLVEPSATDRRPLNRRQAEELLRDIHHIEAEVSGDIQSADDVEALIQAGASTVVLGSRAIDDPDWLASTASAFPDLLLVETAARERRVRSRGWLRTLSVDVRDLADEISGLPLAGLLIRFGPDALLDHSDLSLVEDLVERSPFPIEIAGGVHSLTTLRDLEFRGASATIIDAAHLADTFDERTLARSFVD
jgi:phosphoribosylformimino-5-aminoimidazole carboxamide ribonucleotide (ProFAR) isomerase